MSKLVSIVLPVYNGEKFLRDSIESIIGQTYKNLEIIVVDDCSTDSTPSIVKEYAKKDKRVLYYKNPTNLRLPKNLNRGFSLSSGEYLTWTSDDNIYFPNAIEKMVEVLETHKRVDFVYASCQIIDECGKQIEEFRVKKGKERLIVGTNVVGACFMYTRKVYETIGDYDPQLTLVEDFDYWQRICSQFNSYGIEETLYAYRRHANALTNTMRQEEFKQNLEKMLLKNSIKYKRLNLEQKFFLYNSLYHANPKYKKKYELYSIIYFFFFRLPDKVRRLGIINK